jgi:hypothetical protein
MSILTPTGGAKSVSIQNGDTDGNQSSFENTDAINNPLYLWDSADFTGGNSANTLNVTVYYVIVDV